MTVEPRPVPPTVTIAPERGLIGLNLGELWAFHELLYFFVWRDLKIRYRQTAFGVAWALIQPLLMMAIFTLVLGRVSGLAPSGVPYPIFALAGLVPWTLFAQSLTGSSANLVTATNLLQKVYFRDSCCPSRRSVPLPDFLVGVVALLCLMLVGGILPTASAILALPVAALGIVVATSVGIWLSAINVRYRDVRYAVPFLLQAWLFASPVAYPTAVIPEEWRGLYSLNPMVGVIEGFRWALWGRDPHPC